MDNAEGDVPKKYVGREYSRGGKEIISVILHIEIGRRESEKMTDAKPEKKEKRLSE